MGSAFTGNTLMTDSIVTDEWIKRACAENPAKLTEQGLITTGPVRLAFCDTIFEPKAPMNQPGATPKYSVCALYSPFVDINVFLGEYYRLAGEQFRDHYNANLNQYTGLENPFHDCVTKSHKFQGFTPGLYYINHTTKFAPAVVDTQKKVITDRSRVYPGVWAILAVSAYPYGKSPPQPKKGISFGLNLVMIIGDDNNLSGGGADPNQVFKDVKVQPPKINPQTLAGLVPPPPTGNGSRMPSGPAGMPGMPSAGLTLPPPPNPLYGAPKADDDDDMPY